MADLTEADYQSFAERLVEFRASLDAPEQAMLDEVFVLAGSASEVEGFETNLRKISLMGEILSNISKTRSEISMTFARNARA
jgi:hypothetical protein